MKFTVLALGAAVAGISCVSPCFAQLNIESANTLPQSRLAFQDSETGLDVFGQAPSSAAPAASSDYFADGAPGAGLGDPRLMRSEQPSTFTSAAPSIDQSPAPAPVQAPLGALANTPEVGMVPVCWPEGVGGCQTPNPIADFMMLNWCTDGLWDTYHAHRACQCEHIQHHTGHYNRYTHGCATCAQVQAWPTPVVAGCDTRAGIAPLAGVAQVPQRPVAQLVISPVMSAPVQLPTAQIAPSPTTSASSSTSTQAVPVQQSQLQQPQPSAQPYRATANPLPAEPLPTEVPIVARRSAGFFR